MSFTMIGSLSDLFPDFIDRASRQIVDEVTDNIRETAERNTPTAEIPLAYHGDVGTWIKDRKGRRPGTLKTRWKTRPGVALPDGVVRGEVLNDDPIASYVEDDTRPHMIRARKPGGILRFPQGLDFVFRTEVSHPGTEGQHMLRDALAETEASWTETADRVLEAIASEENRRPVAAL